MSKSVKAGSDGGVSSEDIQPVAWEAPVQRDLPADTAEPQAYPFVTVLIPVRNEASRIGECLEALSQTTYPKDRLEILLLDGESDDGTAQIARDLASSALPVRVVTNPKRSRCAALNLGIRLSRGDVIMRVDARNVTPPEYISLCIGTLLNTGAWNVGGVLRPLHRTRTQQAIGLAMSHPFGVGNAQFRLGSRSGSVETIYLGCFRREVFSQVGMFDEDAAVLSEDSEMNQRIRQVGGELYLNSDIQIFYYPRETMRAHARLYFRYGGARAGNVLKHGTLTSFRQLVPLVFVTGLLATGILGLLNSWFLVLFAVMTSAYVAADTGLSFGIAVRQKRLSLIPRLIAVFPCMHFSWAFGFFYRLFQPRRSARQWGS